MFDDIRPYQDDEVKPVIKKLLANQELLASIASFVFPIIYRRFSALTRLMVKILLRLKLRNVNDVHSLQLMVAKLLKRLLEKTSSGFSYDGLQQLDLSKPAIFVSNHRDIALDPALINLALFESNITTVEIAIGDNLLTKDWLTDVMRLNKSFIVKRSEKKKRAMLEASKQLSAYIGHTLEGKQQHVWIAQREGRAKDGKDITNSAVISMLFLNKPKNIEFKEYLTQLNIVPVAIAYEFDPCDRSKARELSALETQGSYQKQSNEDIQSIATGIRGYKGKIHVQFGQPIVGNYQDSKAVAEAIDLQIVSNYQLFETNKTAHAALTSSQSDTEYPALASRLHGLNDNQKKWLLTMYANPVFSKLSL